MAQVAQQMRLIAIFRFNGYVFSPANPLQTSLQKKEVREQDLKRDPEEEEENIPPDNGMDSL